MVYIKANTNLHTLSKKTVFDVRKEENFAEYRRRWYEYPKNFKVDKFPIHLDIESTNACNLRCPFCATTFRQWGTKDVGFMDMALFRKIIDEGAREGLYSIKLSLRGEPLLHPELAEMVRYAREKGILDIYFNTNAMLLDRNVIDKILEAGLYRISISIEGTTKEVYEKHRLGANFEKVKENLENLKNARDKKGMDFPQIRIQTVLLDELKRDFSSYSAFWERYADEVSYLDARNETEENNYGREKSQWACPFLWQRMAILWDGTMLPCLVHRVEDLSAMILGNAKHAHIKEMWKSHRSCELRKFHMEGKSHEITSCVECSYRDTEIRKLNNRSVTNGK